jgi:1-deoxy-D-xylulose-5-phosphate synthase
VDVGICEQHAVTFAAGMAKQGMKPVVAIYSTFLQRSYDQIVHDVCLQDLPVVFCLDRGGLVGEDGATHHGAFDLSYLRHIPGITVMAPRDEAELRNMVATALSLNKPVAVRYPRGVGVGAECSGEPVILPEGEGEMLREGEGALVIALGSRVHPSRVAAEEVAAEGGPDAAVFNARFVKPLPERQLRELAERFDRWLVVEENAMAGGFGSAVAEFLADTGLGAKVRLRRLGLPDRFIEHGKQKELRAQVGLDKDGIKRAVKELAEG